MCAVLYRIRFAKLDMLNSRTVMFLISLRDCPSVHTYPQIGARRLASHDYCITCLPKPTATRITENRPWTLSWELGSCISFKTYCRRTFTLPLLSASLLKRLPERQTLCPTHSHGAHPNASSVQCCPLAISQAYPPCPTAVRVFDDVEAYYPGRKLWR